MTNSPRISEEELHAFIDGELDKNRLAEIDGLVAADPALARRIALFRADKKQLSEVFGGLRAEPLPAEWLERIEYWSSQRRPAISKPYVPRYAIAAIAATLLLISGFWLVYERVGGPNEDAIVAEALAARQNRVQAEETIASVPAASPEARNMVVTTALAMDLKAPDLARLGYQLAAIRIYSGVPGGKAVELDYRNAQNRLFTLYIRRPSSPPRVDLLERGDVRICIWQDDVVGTVMAGEMSAGEMARIASLAYSGLYL
jgi:anti-sigma factor RsiW